MPQPIIKIQNLSKMYRLGEVGTGTLSHDLKRWYYKMRGWEDPYLKIGEANVRNTKSKSDYIWALKYINLEVMPGEVLGIIGKNGAGKSTLLKILSKVTGPTTGSVHYNGRIGSLLEVGTGFHQELTGRENIFLNGAILGMTKAEIRGKLDEIVDFSGVERYIDTPVKRYSSGMMVRLGFAVAAHLESEILIVDEVLAVGDAEFQKKAIGKMQDVSKTDGRTVLFVSHNMSAVRNLCNIGILLSDGQIKRIGEISDVIDYYMNDNFSQIEDTPKVVISDKYRLFPVSKELEFISLERLSPYSIDVTTPLKFKLRITKNKNIKRAQIMALIDDVAEGGTRVGLGFSEIFSIPPNISIFELILTIRNHNVTQGKYIMDFWIGIGDIISSVKYFDAVYDTLTFEVNRYKGDYINTWENYWGKNCFADTEVIVK